MPKTLVLYGPNTGNPEIGFSSKDVETVASENNQLISLSTIPKYDEGEVQTVVIKAHARRNRFAGLVFELLTAGNVGLFEGALEQLALIQKRTGATNLCILCCYSGYIINDSKENPHLLKEVGFKVGTRIIAFNSSKHTSVEARHRDVAKELAERGGEIDDQLAKELSLKFGVTVKYGEIKEDEDGYKMEVGEKHNLHKYPELYRELRNPGNSGIVEQWHDMLESLNRKIEVDGLSYYSQEWKERKRIKDIIRLYDLYTKEPTTIPESFSGQAFLESVYRGKISRAEGWINNGADVNYVDQNGTRAIILATQKNNLKMMDQLIAWGARVDVDMMGYTPLMLAAVNNSLDAADRLMSAGANVNQCGHHNNSPLILASEKGHRDMVIKLLRAGANPNQVTSDYQDSALILASENNFPDVVKELLKAGADANHKNTEGKTALDLAKENGNQSVVNLLQPIADLQNAIDQIKSLKGKVSVRAYLGQGDVLKPLLVIDKDVDRKQLEKFFGKFSNISSVADSAQKILVSGLEKPALELKITSSFEDINERLKPPKTTAIGRLSQRLQGVVSNITKG